MISYYYWQQRVESVEEEGALIEVDSPRHRLFSKKSFYFYFYFSFQMKKMRTKQLQRYLLGYIRSSFQIPWK